MASGMRRTVAQIVWWISVLALVGGLATTFAGMRVVSVGLWAGVGVAGLGLNALLGGELIAGPLARPFTVRGQVVRGEAVIRAGLCDVAVGSCSNDRIASVQHGPLGKPKFAVEDGVAALRLTNPLLPNVAQWQANLARNVLWDLDVRSGLGDQALDLSALRVERVVARSGMGRIEITCPARGVTQMFLRTGSGEIEVRIPQHTGARVVVSRGALSALRVENPRLEALDERRYATANFEHASTQMEIKVEAGAGDIVIL